MQPRVFAVVTAVLLAALGLGSVLVTDWTPKSATAAATADAGGQRPGAVPDTPASPSPPPPATRRCGPARRCATS
ncbi:hypothetical protein ACFQ2M_03825 [Kitasatospora saccharophila]|uniref:hypothetical protein n=1 Tax=Kitasatospora saccharophila TaxID=407973 RepID=UPI0036352073